MNNVLFFENTLLFVKKNTFGSFKGQTHKQLRKNSAPHRFGFKMVSVNIAENLKNVENVRK